jgi:hypothetical protein
MEAPPGTRSKRPSLLALVLAPVPGLGHWAVRRAGRGLLAFMMLASGLNIVLLAAVMAPVVRLSAVWGWLLAGVAVVFSLVDVTRIVLKSRASPA